MAFEYKPCWFVIVVIILAAFGSSCVSNYELPDNIENPAVIVGDILREDDSTDTRIILNFRTDEAEAPPGASGVISLQGSPKYWEQRAYDLNSRPGGYYDHLEEIAQTHFEVIPGKRSLDIQVVRKTTKYLELDIDIRPAVELDLLAGGTYQVKGERILGSAFKYWVEDTISGKRITDVYYDPDGLRDILIDLDTQKYLPDAHGLLEFSAGGAFANKTVLLPDHDCFQLIRRGFIDPELTVISLLLAPIGYIYTGETGFKVYEELCIDVEIGHVYELTSLPVESSDAGMDIANCSPIPDSRYELWDRTGQKRVLEFDIGDLDLVLDDVE